MLKTTEALFWNLSRFSGAMEDVKTAKNWLQIEILPKVKEVQECWSPLCQSSNSLETVRIRVTKSSFYTIGNTRLLIIIIKIIVPYCIIYIFNPGPNFFAKHCFQLDHNYTLPSIYIFKDTCTKRSKKVSITMNLLTQHNMITFPM
jgi:hypothetical protein